jgi:hypothetical protein
MTTLVAGGDWFVILPILCCGLPLLLSLLAGTAAGSFLSRNTGLVYIGAASTSWWGWRWEPGSCSARRVT